MPIIGIEKRRIGNEISITPDFAAAEAVASAGADVIALDCSTSRASVAEPWRDLLQRIHSDLGKPALADIASLDEAVAAQGAGADAVATTLYGFTPETAEFHTVNWDLVERMVRELRVPVIVEGHLSQPEEVKRALDFGAFAVVIGSAITRPEAITARFVRALHS